MVQQRPGGPWLRGSGRETFRIERTFPVVPVAARLARAAVRATCAAWCSGSDACEVLVMAVSELVGNAVRHTCGQEVTVRLSMTPRRVRLEVVDSSPEMPQLRHSGLAEEGGRGLWLVSELATRWGVEPEPPGKRVWVEIALPAA